MDGQRGLERDAVTVDDQVCYEELSAEYEVEPPKCPECGQDLRHDPMWRTWRCNCGPDGHIYSEASIRHDARFANDSRQKGPI